MKKNFSFLLLLIFLVGKISFSQTIIAGSGSAGLIISNPGINLSVSVVGNTVSGSIDLDCDSIADMRVDLYKGPTAIDGANTAYLFVLNPAFEICADTGYIDISPVNYYNAGDSLICPGSSNWSNDTIFKLGDAGCMDCSGPFSASNLFIGYRNILTSQTGWIKISFYLNDGPTGITLSIPQVLSPCVSTACGIPPPPPSGSGTGTCGMFTYNYTINSPVCNGDCNGSISITSLSGGTPSYYYDWCGAATPSGDGTPNISNLCAGSKSIKFTDAAGHSCITSFSLLDPAPITYSFITSNVSCYGLCDGTICTSGLSGGSAPYTYLWNGPPAQTTPCITGACAGNYAVCVTDASGCMICDTAVIYEPYPLLLNETVTNESCFGCCNGSASVIASGGDPGYTYYWAPSGATGAFISGLCSGTYTCCVTDMNGCQTCQNSTISFSTGINDTDNSDDISVSPNPFNDVTTFEIHSNKNETYSFELTDVLGKNVRSITGISEKQFQFSRNGLENGIYFYKIYSSESVIGVGKLIIE